MTGENNTIINARSNEKDLNILLEQYKFFIIRCCSDFTKKYIDASCDEFSVAQMAFLKAVEKFDPEREANFKTFAAAVIRNALIDEKRKNNNPEISVSPTAFQDNVKEDAEEIDYAVKEKIYSLSQSTEDTLRSDEIDAIGKTLSLYGFGFFELADCSPKAKKTKNSCAVIVRFLLNNKELLADMRKTFNLPAKIICENTGVPRKILDRHRKYIIAAVEIISGDYPYLSEYLRYIKEGNERI